LIGGHLIESLEEFDNEAGIRRTVNPRGDDRALSIPTDEPNPSTANDQAEGEESVLISELIRCIQSALAPGIFAIDRTPFYRGVRLNRVILERVAMCIVFELDKQFHVLERGCWRCFVEVFTEGCRVVLGEECDIGFEQSVGVSPVASELCYEVGADGIRDLNLCGLVRVNMIVGVESEESALQTGHTSTFRLVGNKLG